VKLPLGYRTWQVFTVQPHWEVPTKAPPNLLPTFSGEMYSPNVKGFQESSQAFCESLTLPLGRIEGSALKGRRSLALQFLCLFAVALLVSFVLTRQVRDLATRRGLVSVPKDSRHVHHNPLPRLGGVSIFIAFSLTLILWLILGILRPSLLAGVAPAILLRIYVPACLIFCLGIYDDLRGAGPYLKFFVQALAASWLFFTGMRILDLPLLFGYHQFPWFVGLPLTVLWVVAITNSFNLIDGLDGLAAGSALFSTMVVFVV
jgi:UDP-GlcNAc:undecaprenyl-phosphate GlcNAc-1-phosphate transferase